MTSSVEEHSDGHGRLFMGLYLQLIARYLRMDLGALLRSVDEDGIKIALEAQKIFVTS
jgi:hypothetical protein